MSAPILPVVIQGPAVAVWNGMHIYVQKNIEVKLNRESFNVETAEGMIDTRHKSQKYEVTLTPVGAMNQELFDGLYFAATDIGKSIFPASPELVIHSITEDKNYTFTRAGITKMPAVELVPTKTCWDSMTFTAIGEADVQPTDAAFMKVYGTPAAWGSGYDETEVLTDIYRAALGARSAPYDAMGSKEGFKIEPLVTVKEMHYADLGIAEIVVASLDVHCSFAPSNLTQQQIDVLLGLQDTVAVLPGQSYAKAGENLVISADAFVATLYQMGAKDAEHTFEIGEHQHKGMLWTSRRKFTAGVMQPLWDFSVV